VLVGRRVYHPDRSVIRRAKALRHIGVSALLPACPACPALPARPALPACPGLPAQRYHGIVRLVYFRPISAASWDPVPIITPSLIMSTTLVALTVLRKKILLALVAASTRARAACSCGGSGPGPFFTPSENAMSPGPHSAKPTPGTLALVSA